MSAVLLVNGAPRAVTIGVTGPQGPPGPAVTPGTAGQVYVTNAAATAPVFVTASGDVSMSASTPGQYTVNSMNGVTGVANDGAIFQYDAVAGHAVGTLGGTIRKIHIVGDSNLAGSNGDTTGNVGVLRNALYQILRLRRSDFDFIGSAIDTPESCSQALFFSDAVSGRSMADVTSGYAGYVASAGVGTPDIIIDLIGASELIVSGDSLAQMQTARVAMDAAIAAVAPNARRIVLGILPIVNGTAGATGFNTIRLQYNSWLQNTYVPSKGAKYHFLDVSSSLGQGNYQGDGTHLNQSGDVVVARALADLLDQILGRDSLSVAPRQFQQRQPWYSIFCNGAGNGASVAANTGFNPGTGSYIFAVDFYPTSLPSAGLQLVAQYGTYGVSDFWALYQQGQALRLYWNTNAGTIFSMPDEACLTVGRWHRIVFIADASTGTVGLYVNGQCVGVAQGVSAWSMTQHTFYLGDGPTAGCPGYYSRAYAAANVTSCPRPGSMAAQIAAEDDYYNGSGLVSSGRTAGYYLNNNLSAGYYNQPALVLNGTCAFVSPYPNGTPLRPWELPGGSYASEAFLAQWMYLTPGLMTLTPSTSLVVAATGTVATTGNIRGDKNFAIYAKDGPGNDGSVLALDGAGTLTMGNTSRFTGAAVLCRDTYQLRAVVGGSSGYLDADTHNFRTAAAGALAQITAGLAYFGGSGATAPAKIDWTTSTTPALISGTSATSLTVATNKSGASLALASGATLGNLTLSNPSGSLVKAATAGQRFAHQVSKSTDYTVDGAGAGDEQIVLTAAINLTLPDPTISAGRILEVIVAYNAAVANYTLVRHGTEKINGSAASLTCADALGNIRFIRCDGTDWYTKAAST